MIVVDSSAIVAIARREAEREMFSRVLVREEVCLLSAVSLHETSLVLTGRAPDRGAWTVLQKLLWEMGIEVVAFDLAAARLAHEAFLRFGKGRHPAALNLGDCASYALAKQRGAPLLYKGNDFARTDIVSALTP